MEKSNMMDRMAEIVQHQLKLHKELRDSIQFIKDTGRTTYTEDNRIAELTMQIQRDLKALQSRGYRFELHGFQS